MIYLPSCDWSKTNISTAYQQLNIKEDEITFLQNLGEIIIPSTTEVPGADELALHDFVLVIVNDCLADEDREKFMEGLRLFKSKVPLEDHKGKHDEAVSMMQKMDDDSPELSHFTRIMKNLVIEGFMKSSFYMTDIMPYDMTPGSFSGKVKIQDNDKINIYG